MPNRQFRKNPYASDIKVPLRFTLSYFAILVVVGYALGIQIATPFGMPTGYSVAGQDAPQNNVSGIGEATGRLLSVAEHTPHHAMAGQMLVRTEGFNMLQPITTKIDLEREAIDVRFLKVMPTRVTIGSIEVTNAASGKRCATIGFDPQISAVDDTFSMHAQGCGTEATSEGVIAYDVVTEYNLTVGSDVVSHSNHGRIRVL